MVFELYCVILRLVLLGKLLLADFDILERSGADFLMFLHISLIANINTTLWSWNRTYSTG